MLIDIRVSPSAHTYEPAIPVARSASAIQRPGVAGQDAQHVDVRSETVRRTCDIEPFATRHHDRWRGPVDRSVPQLIHLVQPVDRRVA